jgi:hypothetical protein
MFPCFVNTNPNPNARRLNYTSRRHISPISALKAQLRVQLCLDIKANDRRSLHLLRVNVDVVRLEAGTRSFGVALEDKAFGLRRVETLVVPAGLG